MGYTNKYLNKYTYAKHYNSISSDGNGGLYFPNPAQSDSIIHLNFNYEVIDEITIPDLQNQVKQQEIIPYSKRQYIFNISVIDDSLFLSLSDNTTCVINEEGEIENVLNTYNPRGGKSYESPNNTIRCVFLQLKDKKILTIAQSKFQGSQLAVSSNVDPDYRTKSDIKSNIISHTYNFPNDYMCPVFNSNLLSGAGSLINRLDADKLSYSENKDPNKAFIHFASEMKIWDVVELNDDYILLFVYTNLSNKADQPNKNMPYYLCKMEKSTGLVEKVLNPADRGINHLNLFPKFIVNQGRILFKTSASLYQITPELELEELLEFSARSPFKKFTPIAYDDTSLHFIIPDKTELFSCSNDSKIELNIKAIEKQYKTQKKGT